MHQLDFASGSLDTLIKIVEANQGITILPNLALRYMTPDHLDHVGHFRGPTPAREIGLVTYRHFVKEGLVEALKSEILRMIPSDMKQRKKREVMKF